MPSSSRSVSREGRRGKVEGDAGKLVLPETHQGSEWVTTVQTGNDFAQKLTKHITTSMPGTYAYSPPLVRWLLGMAEVGADESTGSELRTGLQLIHEREPFAKSHSRIWNDIQAALASTHTVLLQSTKLIVPQGYALTPAFTQTLASLYHTEVHHADFSDPNNNQTNWITTWLANENVVKKSNPDPTLLPPTPELLVTEHTRILLLSAAYFTGDWKDPFEPRLTKKGHFHLTRPGPVRTILVDMMHQKMSVLYADLPDLDAHVISLPYSDNRLELLLVKRKHLAHPDLSKLRQSLQHSNLITKLVNQMNVSVQIPRFRIESTTHLIPALQSLGIRTPFSPYQANFSAITPFQSDLFISEIVQTVRIQVRETAADEVKPEVSSRKSPGGGYGPRSRSRPKPPSNPTSGGMKFTGGSGGKKAPKLLYFHANQPFIFQIVDRPTGLILFIGTCTNPLLKCSLC